MHIHIHIPPSFSKHSFRGIGTYADNLHTALQQAGTNHTFSIGEHSANADIIHYPYFDFFFNTLPLRRKIPQVVTIHDTIPLIFPQEYPKGIKGSIRLKLQKLKLSHSDAIITDSDQSRNDIHKYLNIEVSKIHAIHLAPSPYFHQTISDNQLKEIKKKHQLNNPYILYVGDINYNKNIPQLLKIFSQINTSHKLTLVCKALGEKSKEAAEIRMIIATHNLIDRVSILANVPKFPEMDLLGIYKCASWYIQPSLYEGFGLPPLEAMAAGTPVISSKGGSLKEIVSKAAITFDPTNQQSMKKAILFALNMNKNDQSHLISEASKYVTTFNWDQTAAKTLKVYELISKSI